MKILFRFALVLMILSFGAAIAWLLIATRPQAERKKPSIAPPMVETVFPTPKTDPIFIDALGRVDFARKIDLSPEVSGKIVWVSPNLMPGGRFEKGDVICKIEDLDYQAALASARADLASARSALKTEKSRRTVAQDEWRLFGDEASASAAGKELALRIPQLENARAALAAAQSRFEKARLDVARTRILAPFNAVVVEKKADLGKYAAPSAPLAVLAGTDVFWVKILMPVSRIPWILIPKKIDEKGSAVTVFWQESAKGGVFERTGRVVRLFPDLDPEGQMAQVLAVVENPLENISRPEDFPLLQGAYVQVRIQGPVLSHAYVIPEQALREGDRLWLVSDEKKLRIENIRVLIRKKNHVVVSGVPSDALVITSDIPTPVPGMALRLPAKEKSPALPENDS